MNKRKTKKIKISIGEKILYTCAVLALCSTFLLKIFCSANIGNLNIMVEKLKLNVSTQSKKNESLTMQVNELTSFDYVNNIVKDMGLAYKNENIIIIND